MCLTLFRLCEFYITEIKRGYSVLRNYTLTGGIQYGDQDTVSSDVAIDHTTIVHRIRPSQIPPAQSTSTPLLSSSYPKPSPIFPTTSSSQSTSAEENHHPNPPPSSAPENLKQFSIHDRAAMITESIKLKLHPQLSVFTVMGTQEPHVVRLFPTTTCSCPARSHCYSIISPRMVIGVTNNVTKRPVNLKQLARNKRKRADKTSGRKQPGVLDEDVIPAPRNDDDVLPAQHDNDEPTEDEADVSPVPEERELRDDVCYSCSAAETPSEKKTRKLKDNKIH